MGATPQHISFQALDAYARRYDIVGYEFERFVEIIFRVDQVYLEHHEQKRKSEEARNKAKQGRGRRK
jgi:hypothetical protein